MRNLRSHFAAPRLAVAALFTLLLLPSVALAERNRGIPAQIFRPAQDSKGFFVIDSPEALDKATVDFMLGFTYGTTPLVLDFSGAPTTGDKDVLNHIFTLDLGLAIGFTKNLTLGIYMPLHRVAPHETFDKDNEWGFVYNDPFNTQKSDIPKSIPGDTELTVKYALFSAGGFMGALQLGLILPFGVEEVFGGEHKLALRPGLLLGYRRGPLSLFTNIKYLVRDNFQVNDPVDDTRVLLSAGEELQLSFGVKFDIGRHFSIMAAAQKFLPLELLPQDTSNTDDRDAPMELMGGLQWRPAMSLAVNIVGGTDAGLNDTYGRQVPVRVGAHLVWSAAVFKETLKVGDRDGDGVPDDVDNCPDNKEDKDNFEDEDGCPDPDNDMDGIPDKLDKCPIQPEDEDGFEDKDGCPDPDNDGDGVMDSADSCPGKDADKESGFKKTKEDKDNFQDDDGCPELDNDKDGIPDSLDKCPNQKETFNGIDDNDGCPDAAMGPRIKGGKILLKGKLRFERGKAVIKRSSYRLLLGISNLLKSNLEIRLVRIEGHTDNRGRQAKNVYLSTARAAAVRAYLISKGVAPYRLQAVGYGSRYPIRPNNSKKNRAANRRVEFIIVYQ